MRLRKISSFIVATILLILTAGLLPAEATSDHSGGQIRVRWTANNLFLNQSSYIEHEIIPTATTTFIDGAAFRWSNQYHFDFCWQSTSKLSNVGQRCGYVGFGLGSKNGANYYGNFDFAIFNSIAFVTTKTEPNTTCNNSGDGGYIDKTQTYYMNCWKGIAIQMGTPYILRVQWDPSNTPNDDNWWSASLINKSSNETITIGKIKAFGNSYKEALSTLETVIFYAGDVRACDALPIMDMRVLPARSSTATSSFISEWTDKCVRAVALPSKEFEGYYSIRLGGAKPETREVGYAKTTSSSPTPSKNAAIDKPTAPIFSGIKISGNTLNIKVNLNSSEPDMVYLISPKLTSDSAKKVLAEIENDSATWSIKFDPRVTNGNIPISFYSVKNGVVSTESKIDYLITTSDVTKKITSKVPNSPSAINSKLVGNELIVSAKISTSGSAAATSASLFSQALNISKSNPINGDLLNNAVVFSIPVTSKVLSGKIDLNIFASNQVGSSKVGKGSYSLPVPKSPVITSNRNVVTVVCTKGPTIRTFASKYCPPGWQEK